MSLGTPTALGRTAEIYSWKENKILKLFHEGFSDGHVRYEAKVAHAVHAAGLPVPEVGDLVKIGGRLGLEYERVTGITLSEAIATRPWQAFQYARLLAELHFKMHEIEQVEGIPSLTERLERKIREAQGLRWELIDASLETLRRMPKGNRLCHGDFHPGNVLLTRNGPIVIDWIDVTLGDPLADVARTTILLEGWLATDRSVSRTRRMLLSWLHRFYVRRYFALRGEGKAVYTKWQPLVAAGRMSEGIEELAGWLQAQVEGTWVADTTQGG